MRQPTLTFPKFKHPEVTAFYEYDLSIPREKVMQILELPRQTLIQDMELMIRDWMDRDDYFRSLEKEDQSWAFHFHALWVLVELNAKEALPTLLELLKQDDDFSWHWFSDYATESLWEVFYHLGAHAPEQMKEIVLAPGEWINRIVPTAAFEQIALHHPEKRTEVMQWYSSILTHFLSLEDDDPALDGEVVSTIVDHLISIQAKELLPVIERLYQRGLVLDGTVGSLSSVKKDIAKPGFTTKRATKASIFERYQETKGWFGYQTRNDKIIEKNKKPLKNWPNILRWFMPKKK